MLEKDITPVQKFDYLKTHGKLEHTTFTAELIIEYYSWYDKYYKVVISNNTAVYVVPSSKDELDRITACEYLDFGEW